MSSAGSTLWPLAGIIRYDSFRSNMPGRSFIAALVDLGAQVAFRDRVTSSHANSLRVLPPSFAANVAISFAMDVDVREHPFPDGMLVG